MVGHNKYNDSFFAMPQQKRKAAILDVACFTTCRSCGSTHRIQIRSEPLGSAIVIPDSQNKIIAVQYLHKE